jgi:putative mRNA 3-end processing factor
LIRSGNGIVVDLQGRRFRFDPRRIVEEDLNMISHAHSDHIPSSFRSREVICSEITRDLVRVRRRKELDLIEDDHVRMFDAGHIPGSNMFLVRGDKTVLYTGDYCTRRKPHLKPARPHKCDILVTEATYGRSRYVFPDHDDTIKEVRDWLRDLLAQGHSAVLYAYPLGKSQELAAALKDFPLRVNGSIAENNRVLSNHGYDLCTEELKQADHSMPCVYLTSGMGRERATVSKLKNGGAKTAMFSGWTLNSGFRYSSAADRGFPLSDHCGFDELLEFVRGCGPETVYTTHGFVKEFAKAVRDELGIESRPLIAKQRMIDQFC